MGNALEAAKFSVEKGNLGVDTKESLLKGIDEFNVGVQTWKENIDTQRLELKQNTAEKYREAEKKVQENLPSNKTERDLALKALSNYKDQLYANMGLVQAGAIKPEDNLIFQENGKQSFEIIASQINNYAKRKQEYIDRAKGGYIKNKDGTETYVEPKAGAYEAALRDFQDRMGNPEFTNVSFGENGMGKISFYKTKIDPQTSTRVLDLDADGNPQSIQGLEGMSVLAFDRDRNQKADRIYLQKEAQKLIGQGSLLGNTYEEMRNRGMMFGTVEDDMRQNPGLKDVLDTAVSTVLSTPDRIVSVLSDNALSGQESIPVNKAQWSQLTNAQRNETVEYSYTKADGTTATGVKSKYIELVTSQNNQIVPNLSDRDREAAENITRSTLYNSLKKDITDKGTKSTQFQKRPPTKDSRDEQKTKNTFTLIKEVVVDGNRNSLESIVRQDENLSEFKITNEGIVFTKVDGSVTAPIKFGEGVNALDTGKLLSSELGYNAEQFANESKIGADVALNKGVSSFKDFNKPKKANPYQGLGTLAVGKDGKKYTMAIDTIKDNDDEDKMVIAATKIIEQARRQYDNIPNIEVDYKDESGAKDTIKILIDGKVVGSSREYAKKNADWLRKNLDKALKGEYGGVQKEDTGDQKSGVDYSKK